MRIAASPKHPELTMNLCVVGIGRENSQIGIPVVRPIPVDMMNNRAFGQQPSNRFLNNDPVFGYVFTCPSDAMDSVISRARINAFPSGPL